MQAATLEQIFDCIHESVINGAGNVMAANEAARGYKLVLPGDVPWLPPDIWPEDVVISLDGPRVRIVAIYTPHTGQGHFSKLVDGILAAGLIPTVIAPMGEMNDILTNWGWHRRLVGSSFDDRYDEWFPTRKWKQQRSKR